MWYILKMVCCRGFSTAVVSRDHVSADWHVTSFSSQRVHDRTVFPDISSPFPPVRCWHSRGRGHVWIIWNGNCFVMQERPEREGARRKMVSPEWEIEQRSVRNWGTALEMQYCRSSGASFASVPCRSFYSSVNNQLGRWFQYLIP